MTGDLLEWSIKVLAVAGFCLAFWGGIQYWKEYKAKRDEMGKE